MKTVSPQRSRRLAAAALLAPPRPRREYSKWSRDEESAFFEALKVRVCASTDSAVFFPHPDTVAPLFALQHAGR